MDYEDFVKGGEDRPPAGSGLEVVAVIVMGLLAIAALVIGLGVETKWIALGLLVVGAVGLTWAVMIWRRWLREED